MSLKPVRAGGGVVLREHNGLIQVLLIHRPRHRDWSHPKGKCDKGEKYVDAALREVREETGLVPSLGPRLSNVVYPLPSGREKKVKYWVMWPDMSDGAIVAEPDREVDDLVWVRPSTAMDMLTYPHDRDLLTEALEAIIP